MFLFPFSLQPNNQSHLEGTLARGCFLFANLVNDNSKDHHRTNTPDDAPDKLEQPKLPCETHLYHLVKYSNATKSGNAHSKPPIQSLMLIPDQPFPIVLSLAPVHAGRCTPLSSSRHLHAS
jgi:hypothetical protein